MSSITETTPTTSGDHHPAAHPGVHTSGAWDFTFSGLAASFLSRESLLPAHLDDEQRGVLKAILSTDQNFFPFEHTLDLLNVIIQLVQQLHYHDDAPRSVLVTGPKGIGKSYLFRAIGNSVVLQAMRGPIGDSFSPLNETFSFHIDLSKELAWPSFTRWALRSTAAALGSGASLQKAVSLIIRQLPEYAADFSQGDDIHYDSSSLAPQCVLDAISQAKAFSTDVDVQESWWTGVTRDPSLGQVRTPLEVLSVLLRHCSTCVLFIVDEAESLFQSNHFKYPTAKVWLDQMRGTLDIGRSTFGIILCASFQRARQLFLYDGHQHELPGHYLDHAGLRSNWNETKFKHLRVPPPVWSSHTLALFILSHNINSSRWRVGQQSLTAGAAASGAGDASGDASIVLKEAKLLDQQFLRPANEEMTAREIIEGALSVFLAKYGIIPRRLAAAMAELHRSMLKVAGSSGVDALPCRWPRPEQSRDVHRAQQYSRPAAAAFEAYLSLKSSNLLGAGHVGYDPTNYATTESQLFDAIPREPGVTILDHEVHVHRCIDAALDAGILAYLQHGQLALAEPAFFLHRVCRGLVSYEAVSWLQHPGYGEEAELVLARALRRFSLTKGLGNMPKPRDVSVLTFGDRGSVDVSNEDSTAPRLGLATLNVIALQQGADPNGDKPLTEKAVTVAMVNDVFGKEAIEAVPSRTPHRAWLAAKRAAAVESPDISPETLAAFLSARTIHPEVLSRLDAGGELQPVLLKEYPDALGGDLVGVFPCETADGVEVHIFRIQVKVATQKSLQAGVGSKASVNRCTEAVSNFLGAGVNVSMMAPDDPKQKAFKGLDADDVQQLGAAMAVEHTAAVEACLEQRHYRASSAIADVVAMATALAGFKECGKSCELSKDLAEYFQECRSKASWRLSKPYLITTHSVGSAASNMAQRYQVNVLDASELNSCWGRIGEVCETLGLLPFAEPTAQPSSLPSDLRRQRFGLPKPV